MFVLRNRILKTLYKLSSSLFLKYGHLSKKEVWNYRVTESSQETNLLKISSHFTFFSFELLTRLDTTLNFPSSN